MNELIILGINVTDRIKEAGKAQQVLSEFADCIKIRLGFHELSEEVCSRNAFIIVQLKGEKEKCIRMEDKLNRVEGLVVKKMCFNY